MMESALQVFGTVLPNGSLLLEGPLDFPAGPVKVVISQVKESPLQNPSDWLQIVRETRAKLESLGIPMMDDEQTAHYIRSMRETDSLDEWLQGKP
jgi:hypothetical protein